jgi:hypothetical protein
VRHRPTHSLFLLQSWEQLIETHAYFRLCTNPSIKEKAQFNDLTAGPKLALLTSIIGTFIGVKSPNSYDAANPEFWCKVGSSARMIVLVTIHRLITVFYFAELPQRLAQKLSL